MKNVVSKVLMMFVVSFMLFTCSYASDFDLTARSSVRYYDFTSGSSSIPTIAGYTSKSIATILVNYKNDSVTYDFEYKNMISQLENEGYQVVIALTSDTSEYLFVCIQASDVYFGVYDDRICWMGDYAYAYRMYGILSMTGKFGLGSVNLNSPCSFSKKISNIVYSTSPVKKLFTSYVWDGESYYYKASTTPDTSIISSFSDDELASIVNTFINSEDFITNRPSGYDDFFITYSTISEQFYAYLYKSEFDLGMVYGEFDDNGNFEPNGLSSGEGYRVFWHNADDNILKQVWNNLKSIIQPTKYLNFRINPEINKVHYITTYEYNISGSHLLFTSAEENIVYSTKDIKLIVRDGESTVIDVDNSYNKSTLINSTTNEEYQFELPSISVSETPWQRLVNIITFIPSKIADAIANKMGFNKVMFILSPLFETIYEIIGVFLACLAFVGRAIMFVYTLPTIEASSALFSVDVDTTTKGLAFAGNTWGTHFLSGLDKLKALSWGGASLWSFFEAFVVALVAVIAIKLVRKHYHM